MIDPWGEPPVGEAMVEWHRAESLLPAVLEGHVERTCSASRRGADQVRIDTLRDHDPRLARRQAHGPPHSDHIDAGTQPRGRGRHTVRAKLFCEPPFLAQGDHLRIETPREEPRRELREMTLETADGQLGAQEHELGLGRRHDVVSPATSRS